MEDRGRGRRLRRKTEGGGGGDSCSLRVLHVTQDANKVKTFFEVWMFMEPSYI